jgi:hypothetical protein
MLFVQKKWESMDHILCHCFVVSALWNAPLTQFGLSCVMPRRVIDLFACWWKFGRSRIAVILKIVLILALKTIKLYSHGHHFYKFLFILISNVFFFFFFKLFFFFFFFFFFFLNVCYYLHRTNTRRIMPTKCSWAYWNHDLIWTDVRRFH